MTRAPQAGQPRRSRTALRSLSRLVKREALVLWLAARDTRTPWRARLICALATAYVFSPIQLLPDWIPVVGYVDDVAVLVLASWIALKLMPRDLLAELRKKADAISDQPTSWVAAAVVLLIWLGLSAFLGLVVWRAMAPRQ